jgi:tRNA A-37 threonylcarbamoyl transferase component Bud32
VAVSLRSSQNLDFKQTDKQFQTSAVEEELARGRNLREAKFLRQFFMKLL